MPIAVICPGCKTSFRVSEKFAGQTGPCPKCKAPIAIPAAGNAEVKIHGPDAGPKDAKGRPVFKPLRRIDAIIGSNTWLIGAGCFLMVLLAAWLLGKPLQQKFFLRAVGVAVLTPGMCVASYIFLRDREKLDLFSGKALWLRTAICTACYLVLWGAYAYVSYNYNMPTEVWHLFVIMPALLTLGAIAALGSYELEFGGAMLHYCFNLLTVVALAYVAGIPMLPTIKF